MKDSMGFVHIKGMVKGGTVSASTQAFTLPDGYRPAKKECFVVNSNWDFGVVRVDSGGKVLCEKGSNAFFYLDGITFKAA